MRLDTSPCLPSLCRYFWNILLVSVAVAVVLTKAGYVFHLRLRGPDHSMHRPDSAMEAGAPKAHAEQPGAACA